MAEDLIFQEDFSLPAWELPMKSKRPLSESEILEQVKNGNKEAYQEIVTSYMKKAYYVALGYVHNQQDALDLSQETFIKAYRRINQFDTRKPFFPWFYEILKNLCLDHMKRQKRKREVPLDGVMVFETETEDREMKASLWKGIHSLPPEQKELILLRYFQQMSYREIAEMTGKPLGTVMSSLFNAKSRLKEILWRYL